MGGANKGVRNVVRGSPEYKTMLAWIAAGAPGPTGKEPKVERLIVEPPAKTYEPNSSQRLTVRAEYSDGSKRDVTSLALFQPNEQGLAQVDESGKVTALRPGA